ncbi:MAG: DUF4406 domain-containing protein [Pseudomonadota bacterium]
MSWIMVAGPYRSGARDAEGAEHNLRALNSAALDVLAKGHLPVIGVNMAIPMIEAAGADRYDEIMMPVSLELANRCDAILRIGGPSEGADAEVARMQAAGKLVYHGTEDIPEASR